MKNWSNPSIVMQHFHASSTRNLHPKAIESIKKPSKDHCNNSSLKKLGSERKMAIPSTDNPVFYLFLSLLLKP